MSGNARGDFSLTVVADIGYESTTTGRCTADQYEQALGALHGTPIDMVLHCPKCGLQHIDAPSFSDGRGSDDPAVWTNPPHRSHLCAGCDHVWRPADVPTNGVQAIKTKGKADHFPTHCTAETVKNMKRLRELLGYVEDGSSTSVLISQDDATKDWVLKVGKQTYYGRSLESALESAAGG